jgi:hypothetical protein
MLFCEDHFAKVNADRNALQLERAKLQMECVGLDPSSHQFDYRSCPLCEPGVTYAVRESADGRFVLSLTLDPNGPRVLYA